MANQTAQPSGTGFVGGIYIKLADGTYTPVINEDGEIIANIQDALAQGSIYIGDSNGVTSELSVKDDGKILVGNGTTATSVAVSGDVSLTNAGATAVNSITTGSFNATALTESGAIPATASFVTLDSTTPLIAATIAAPAAGRFLVITQIDAGTAGHTVTLTAGTYDGTNNIATFNAQNETLVLFGISATRFVIVENIGAVGLST